MKIEKKILKKSKKIVDNQYENDFISLNDVIIPNHYVGMKDREKWEFKKIISSNSYYINRDAKSIATNVKFVRLMFTKHLM